LAATPLSLLLRGSDDASSSNLTLWQIDPEKCTQCGKCATECILPQSAVKCIHQFASCGYCLFCSGYYQDHRSKFDTAGENLRCPTDAIVRTYVEDPYFEYRIDEDKCIACGKCVKGCEAFGNGSLFLQVRHDLCKNCNQCRIASACPSDAFVKVSPDKPYLIKTLSEGSA
jgi:electron transport complex protein RnfB